MNHRGKDDITAAEVDLTEDALNHGVLRLHSEPDNMSVAVPIESIKLDPLEGIGVQAVRAMQDEIDQITGVSGAPSSLFDTGDPFNPGDPFAPASTDVVVETSGGAEPTPSPEVQAGHEPGL